MQHKPDAPIGIFDSGIGGLTVAHAVIDTLPQENIIYIGDTAHLPYGDKSPAALQHYATHICEILIEKGCKLILIACNSASAAAYAVVTATYPNIAIVNVIDPLINFLPNQHYQRLGLIGTKQTINSAIYQQKIKQLNLNISLSVHATNLLASAIEEFGDHQVIDHLLDIYLSHPNIKHIDALVLACTHYPLIKHRLENYYQNRVQIIDPSIIVAQAVKEKLIELNLMNNDSTSTADHQFYVTDYTENFANNAKYFFGSKINIQACVIWD